jgi:hypothetical protein
MERNKEDIHERRDTRREMMEEKSNTKGERERDT